MSSGLLVYCSEKKKKKSLVLLAISCCSHLAVTMFTCKMHKLYNLNGRNDQTGKCTFDSFLLKKNKKQNRQSDDPSKTFATFIKDSV